MARGKAFANIWEERAAATGLRVFPVRIEWIVVKKKWDKRPLVENWQTANFHQLTDYDWSRANGFGMLMGNGYYALDLDAYKGDVEASAWLEARHVPPTRTHRTVSGGQHLIFMTIGKQRDLPTRAGIVPGLDGRGKGGFIAFGEGYAVADDRAPVILPPPVGDEIAAGAGGGVDAAGEREFVAGYRPPEPEGASAALSRALAIGPKVLRRRWRGETEGMRDRSRSALDHSVARLLGLMGLTEDQIVWVLLERFEHGAARSKDKGHVAIRAAARSALKSAEQKRQEDRVTVDFREPEISDAEEEELRRMIDGEA